MKPSMLRVRVESAVAAVAGALALLTLFWRDWIESLTGWDPDHHNGSAEWLIVFVLLAVALAMGAASWRHWRLRVAATAAR
jgi:H+/Cl- antiporter ClcA